MYDINQTLTPYLKSLTASQLLKHIRDWPLAASFEHDAHVEFDNPQIDCFYCEIDENQAYARWEASQYDSDGQGTNYDYSKEELERTQ